MLALFVGPALRRELVEALAPLGQPEIWVGTLCGLHDLGKVTPTFQGLNRAVSKFDAVAMRDIERVERQAGVSRRVDTPHGIVTALHFRQMLRAWGATPITAEVIAGALGGHHGHFPSTGSVRQAQREVNNHGGARWEAIREDVARRVLELRGLPDPTGLPWGRVQANEVVGTALAALTTLSDWIASDVTNFEFAAPDDLEAYTRHANSLADAAVGRLEWKAWQLATTFVDLFPAYPVRPVQSVVEALTKDLAEPGLVVIEAPTGEGKTKAALQAAAALSANTGAAGAYIAAPTRATGQQTFRELDKLLCQHGDPARPELVHAGAAEFLAELAARPTSVGEDDEQDSDLRAQSWFTNKKNLLAPVGVGTVDQALKGAIRSGHAFVRLVALTNKVFVVDEVHAYDTYMSTLLDRLLAWLGRMGVSVVLLSATLPRRRRDELIAAWRAGALGSMRAEPPKRHREDAYPRVTLATRDKPAEEHPAELSELNASRPLALKRISDDEVVAWALEEAGKGRAVAVVHNLVRRATHTYQQLQRSLTRLPKGRRPKLYLYTGRLTSGQRRAVENKLIDSFGEGGSRHAAIIVGTQVLEQGLDLDFDAMLTDLAPVDVLTQRAGRLHRHSRGGSRGEFVLHLAGVADGDTGPVFPPYLDRVYDSMILLRTWALLRDKKSITLPADVPELIDAVYDPAEGIGCPAGWHEAWQAAAEKLSRARTESNHKARLMYVPHPAALDDLSELTRNPMNTSRTREKSRRR